MWEFIHCFYKPTNLNHETHWKLEICFQLKATDVCTPDQIHWDLLRQSAPGQGFFSGIEVTQGIRGSCQGLAVLMREADEA